MLISGPAWSAWHCVSTVEAHVCQDALPDNTIPTKPGVYEFGVRLAVVPVEPQADGAAGDDQPEQEQPKTPIIVVYVGKTDEREQLDAKGEPTDGGLRKRIWRYAGKSSHKWQLFSAYWKAGYDLYVRWHEAHDMELRANRATGAAARTGATRAKRLESSLLARYDYACNFMENGKRLPRLPAGIPPGRVQLNTAVTERASLFAQKRAQLAAKEAVNGKQVVSPTNASKPTRNTAPLVKGEAHDM